MKGDRWRIWLKLLLGLFVIVLTGAVIALITLDPQITQYVESDAFRAELEKQTAKGLHFPTGRYAPIKRTGFLSAASGSFAADNGRKAMTKVEARDIRAKFNPGGVFLRRWQLEEVIVDSGEVSIRVYEPKPEPSPAKPWYHIFLPDRVYLKQVECDPTDITWLLRNEKGGFFATKLLITPHGRDFEYRATGGTMKGPLIPDLHLRHTHLLITKTLLTLYKLDLAPDAESDGYIHAEGKAGTREDKSVDFTFKFGKLPINDWLPGTWSAHTAGQASGNMHWTGENPKLEKASAQGSLRINNGRIWDLPFLQQLASITRKESLESLELSECAANLDWKSPNGEIRDIAIEDKGKFRIEGAVSLQRKALGGAIELGVAPEYLEWLPNTDEVFPRRHGGYLWTTVHLSGTLEEPKQDLSPRIMEALRESPGAFFGLLLRQLGEWLDGPE